MEKNRKKQLLAKKMLVLFQHQTKKSKNISKREVGRELEALSINEQQLWILFFVLFVRLQQ
jgi:hypothetical protein